MSTIIRSDRGIAAAIAALVAFAPAMARAQEVKPAPDLAAADPLDSLRERFREGMDKYKAGAFADAVVIWESIYRELGSDKGYRLAFDLGRAYEELGELIKAAEHYETYLDRVAARRREGETLEEKVAKQESVARERLEKLAAVKGRIQVPAAKQAVVVRVDNSSSRVSGFTVYVEPGPHVVTFGGGTDADVRRVTVARGELLVVEPPAPAPPAPPAAPETQYATHLERPFSPVVLWIGGGVALVSVVIPIIAYANALSIKSDYEDPSTDGARLSSDYESARSNAYASIAIPAAFTAAVGGLALWYVLGTKEVRVPVTPQANVTASGAALGVSGRF